MKPKNLILTNISENNLKSVSLEIAHNQLVSITGVSGSGKSSLAFDTIYAEGQRRYIETFSPYTRQFLDKLKKPDAEKIENVRPAIAIQQRTRISNSRSTVGSLTNINEYLRALWCQIARIHCPDCGTEIKVWSAKLLREHCKKLTEKFSTDNFYLAAAIRWPAKSAKKNELFDSLKSQGYLRYLNDSTLTPELLEDGQAPSVWPGNISILVLERFNLTSFKAKRLQDAIESAFLVAEGNCLVIRLSELQTVKRQIKANFCDSSWTERYEYSNYPRCGRQHLNIPKLQPALFSYNHPLGACTECKGFGFVLNIDPERCVPNPALTIEKHALHCWSSDIRSKEFHRLMTFCKENLIPTDSPWFKLTNLQKKLIFESKTKSYVGVLPWFKKLEKKAYKMHIRVLLSRYRSQSVCPACKGSRLKNAALTYRLKDLSLPQLWSMELKDLYSWLKDLDNNLVNTKHKTDPIKDLFLDVLLRLEFLLDLGLGYLTLNRQARTLSNGETQRVNLAAAIGSNLTSTHFVLDEPSIGLHARDTNRLIKSVRKLQERGNSVLVVEHDPEFIASADSIIEIGPDSGAQGGQVTYQGKFADWAGAKLLHTKAPRIKAKIELKNCLTIEHATARNLKDLSFKIPLNCLCILSGASGSGKSSLVNELLLPAYNNHRNSIPDSALPGNILGFEKIDNCIVVDQSPLVKNPRANIATYSGIWDSIRQLLAASEAASLKGFSSSFFSFNVDGGRCPECKGAGLIKEDMQFLSDVYMPCELCLGERFQPAVLAIELRGKNVFKLLKTTCTEAGQLFKDISAIRQRCELLELLGLGHLALGHALNELSGGEAQRLKLVAWLEGKDHHKNLLIFDEPTSGLHVKDIQRLLSLFDSLIQKGNSILCIEHNLQVLEAADWVIDLGPEGGYAGGELIFSGPVEQLLKLPKGISYTADYLKIKNTSENKSTKKATKKLSLVKFASANNTLNIYGARQHNLKNLNLQLPLGKTIAFVGVSGSGKSSLAKDILFAEGQRRYLDCLSPYARQFIKGLKKPDIDRLENIPPSIYIGQHTHLPGRLSTVGTLSEVYNYLRLLYSKLATQHCPDHPKEAIANLSALDIAGKLKELDVSNIKILAPIVKKKKGAHKDIINKAIQSEIAELRVDGVVYRASALIEGLERHKAHTIEYVLASCNPKTIPVDLLTESVNQALALGAGTLVALVNKKEQIYSTARACPKCKKGFFKLDPEDFSFSSRRGWCNKCEGSGQAKDLMPCSSCAGSRLNQAATNVLLDKKNIATLCDLSVNELALWIEKFLSNNTRALHIKGVFAEITARLNTLAKLGLDYLSLNQDCKTLSAGELQRVRLAAALGSPLSGVLYLLDEPSASLHPNDNKLVLDQISTLKTNGNTIAIVEHDPDTILAAEHIIELGPNAGSKGGELIFNGSKEDFLKQNSLTANTITASINLTKTAPSSTSQEKLSITKIKSNNLKISKLEVPLGQLVVVAGVSGAGKSSLVHNVINMTLSEGKFQKAKNIWSGPNGQIKSSSEINGVVMIDQSPLGKNSRSTPAVYLKIWDQIRLLLAQTPEARAFGYNNSFFSFNSGKGRCPECEGRGEILLEMSFLSNAAIQCESCLGKRFNELADSITYAGYTPSQILQLTFDQAALIFNNYPKIRKAVKRACDVGLGYLTLGQSSATLSGGEAQRLKIVKELSATSQGSKIYIFDEPTTGLHESDVDRLAAILRELVRTGNSVLVIEHNHRLITQADHLIELGPGPAQNGGKVIFQGTPKDLIKQATPWGLYLKAAKQTSSPKFSPNFEAASSMS